ncbi:MAG TPA: hypothetical protein VMT00_13760, partial [Thermoanaerobaculia bacterium]|nr:hypothetical protein [Thermoanaerobaculia bacterium]
MIDRTIHARSNRYGAFVAPESFAFGEAGEYRVDVHATAREASGSWAGTRTWGGVVAVATPPILAHGQRGIDDVPAPRPQWFFRNQTTSRLGPSHVFLPFHAGDVAWMQRSDSGQPMITYQDLDGSLLTRMKPAVFCCGAGANFDARAAAGEVPLLIGRTDGIDGHVDPSRNDLWGYSYRSVQRPLVRVREEISDDVCSGCYWRFREQYAAQAGIGRNGDLPNDFKFQFGGIVLRGSLIGEPVYAVYGSLFVLVADDDAHGGTRTFPPFQGNGGGPDGGPLFTLKGRNIDLFFHPTAVRPGTILHRGERASFAGYSAPTLPSKIEIVVTSPSGATRTIRGQANAIGWFYDPAQDFVVGEPGVWRAKVMILFDGRTSAGQVTEPFPTGDVLGSREGEFWFYVVDSRSKQLEIESMAAPKAMTLQEQTIGRALRARRGGFGEAALPVFVRPADGPIAFTVTPPPGLTNIEMHVTTTMPGFILEEKRQTSLTYTYD